MLRVLFATKCWGGDWTKFLSGAFERKWQPCDYPFDDKWLMINNEVPNNVQFPMKTFKVARYAKEVLNFFELGRDSFTNGKNDGYYYSIAELAAIYLAKDYDYLCWLQGDVLMSHNKDWVSQGIKLLKDPISVVSPSSEVNTWHNEFGLDQYFSDQCFLIKVKEFRDTIYNYSGILKDFPHYAGNSFEMMVAKYLRANDKYRKILKDVYVHHPCY